MYIGRGMQFAYLKKLSVDFDEILVIDSRVAELEGIRSDSDS